MPKTVKPASAKSTANYRMKIDNWVKECERYDHDLAVFKEMEKLRGAMGRAKRAETRDRHATVYETLRKTLYNKEFNPKIKPRKPSRPAGVPVGVNRRPPRYIRNGSAFKYKGPVIGTPVYEPPMSKQPGNPGEFTYAGPEIGATDFGFGLAAPTRE